MKYLKTFDKLKVDIDEPDIIKAAKKGNSAKIRNILKTKPDSINDTDIVLKRTALIYAVINKYIVIVDILLKNGANPNIKDDRGDTALSLSTTMKNIELLLKYNADVNIKNKFGRTALMEYIDSISLFSVENITIILKKFLEHGLDLDIKDNGNYNFYDLIKIYEESENVLDKIYYKKLAKYMDENFPKYKEEWEFNQDIKNFNL